MEPNEVSGERRLLWELIDEARLCVHGRVSGAHSAWHRQAEVSRAHAWFADPRDWGLGSFLNCCNVLGLDPGSIRRWARDTAAPVPVGHRTRATSPLRPRRLYRRRPALAAA